MKRLLTVLALLAFAASCFAVPSFAQNSDEPASKDDIILYLQTMHSHDLMQKTMEVQVGAMEQLFRDQIQKEKGAVPPEFDTFFKKSMADLIKNMPVDQITVSSDSVRFLSTSFDQLDTVELIMELEDEFDKETVRWALDFIEAHAERAGTTRETKARIARRPDCASPLWDRELDG